MCSGAGFEALAGPEFALERDVVQRIMDFVKLRSGSHAQALAMLDTLGSGSESFNTGVAELREVIELVRAFGVPEANYCINLSIARGLDYYTGTVYETTLTDYPQNGSRSEDGRVGKEGVRTYRSWGSRDD